MSVDLSQFIVEFLQESFEGLAQMESCLLEFTDDPEIVDSIFRAAHSIKGGAGTFGFAEIAEFTHDVETILDEMRSNHLAPSAEIINSLLQSVDVLRMMFNATQDQGEINTALVSSVKARLQAIIEENNPVKAVSTPEKEHSVIEPLAATIAADQSLDNCWLIEFQPNLNMLKSGNEPVYIFAALAELGDLQLEPEIQRLPDIDRFDAECIYLCWALKLSIATADPIKARRDIQEVFEWVEDFCELSITLIPPPVMIENPEPETETELMAIAKVEQETQNSDHQRAKKSSDAQKNIVVEVNKSVKKSRSVEVSSVRVDTEKLDELLDRVGELVVTQSMLTQAGIELLKTGHNSQSLEQGLVQLASNTRDLQEDVMRMRMLPISFVFNRFPRLVHDIGLSLGKKVSLEMSGAETEIDKTVLEKIGDPLTHLLRNALDHGLEMPAQRIASGKSETGTIKLDAYHQNGFIVIDVSDDGMGLDTVKIRAKALQKNLITEEQILSEGDIHALIFKAGFSTVEQLSELSGRGVGMDVVLRNIEGLGGQVNLVSKVGEGSTFRVSVPLTLAIIEGQLININDERYVIPLVSIKETVSIQASEIKYLGAHSQFIDYRDEYIHLIDLKAMLNPMNGQPKANQYDKLAQEPLLIIVAESAAKKVGFIIDALDSQQQFVVKPMEANFKKIEGLVGGTILGDGSVALILDTAGLIAKDQRLNDVQPMHREATAP